MKPTPILKAGAGRTDITPAMGIQLAGDIGRYRPTEEIRDRLYASALVLESGKERFCWLSLDLLAATNAWADRVRHEIARKFKFDPRKVMFHIVQNHATPSVGHCFTQNKKSRMPDKYPWLNGGDDRYNEPFLKKCLEAVGAAVKRLEPVTMHVGRGIDGRVAFNRRFVMRDGTAKTHPAACDPKILHAEGPTDPEVGVATFVNGAGKTVAALLHHTCHPCHGYPHRFVIGDWPGAWAGLMREKMGGDCIPLVINGCCGNIHHCNHIDPSVNYNTNYKDMAAKLMETTNRVLGQMKPVENPVLGFAHTKLPLPLRKLKPEVIRKAEELLDQYPEPKWNDASKVSVDWAWVYAVMILDLKKTQERTMRQDYEIQAFRIGDFALATLMGEPFVEAQLGIKMASPAPHTFVAHFCNGYAGYVPTRRAFKRGGYETDTSNGSKWDPGALEQIEKTAVKLLKQACR